MACFIVPAAEAVITTIATKVIKSREEKAEKIELSPQNTDGAALEIAESVGKIRLSRKLKWLSNMLWGGSVLLLFEHLWHGEVVVWFPFLTSAATPAGTAEMFREMATVGVMMSLLVTVVWLGMVAVTSIIEKKALRPQPASK